MITIIVLVHNAEGYLTKCLNDLRYQTYHKLDIILVNNGSTDSSGIICERYARADSRFRVIHKTNVGISAALNTGLLLTKGKYISFVCAFDRMDLVMYEHLLSIMQKTNADMVICGPIAENPAIKKKSVKNYSLVEWSKTQAIQQEINQNTKKGFLTNKLIKTDLFKQSKTLYFHRDIFLYEDLLMSVECLLKSEKILYLPISYYHAFTNRYSNQLNLSRVERETGLKALMFVLDLCSKVEGLNCARLKERYVSLNSELLREASSGQVNNKQEIERYQKNLTRFKLKELENTKLQVTCLVDRVMVLRKIIF